MLGGLKSLVPALMTGLILGGCGKNEEVSKQPVATHPQPGPAFTPASSSQASPAISASAAPGFDVKGVPVVNPQLGKFPYVGLIDGYRPAEPDSKEVAFDRYEFFDGAKIITVEGRLKTTEAEGTGASAYQVFKTYESLITGLGGVKVFEGKGEDMGARKVEFSQMRHRHPVYDGDQMGIYMVRTPEEEIWVEAYVKQHYGKEGNYFLTVVEKKSLDVKASLLPAEEMKRELDTKGHVALYINFDFNKADVKPEARPAIDEILKLLKNNPSLNLTVEGHTDNAGTPAYNQGLSDARAKSVVAALVANGIEGGRLKAVGYGQEKPIADNGTDAGRAKNRRVELVKMR